MSFGFENFEPDPVWYGRAELAPARPIVAGEVGTWTITYTVGRYGIDNGGRIRLAFRLASDWSPPQFRDPGGADYFTATTTGDADLSVSYERKGYQRPWFRTVTMQAYNGSLKEGDHVTMTLGDRRGGGAGSRAQAFRESAFEFRILVESFETGVFVRVPSSPQVAIVGGDAHRMVVLAPSEVVAGEPFHITVKAEDRWGNPSDSYSGTVCFDQQANIAGLPGSHLYTRHERGVHRFTGLTVAQPGTYVLRVSDTGAGLEAASNPIRCVESAPRHRRFWADLHGQTESTVGTGTVEEYFAFARDVADVSVCTHQGNDFQITRDAWREIQEETARFNKPGQFVTFLGYEWSGNTPAGGDHNVIWFDDYQPIHRSSHWEISDRSDVDLDRYPIDTLYETLRSKRALIIPHIGGRRANLDFHDANLEPVIEICSVHGRFEWFLQEALQRGYRVGVVANGDDHTGRPGAAYATDASFGVRGGLTCLLAHDLTREGVWEALRARRTYATTGERIYLSVLCGDHFMGEAFETDNPPSFEVEVLGTTPLYSVELIRGNEVLYDHPVQQTPSPSSRRLRLAWSGARITGRGRHTVWDGSLRIDGGKFASVREFAFDNRRQGIVSSTPHEVSWISSTSGDMDGLLVDIERKGDVHLHFDTEPCSFEFSLSELDNGPLVWECGGVDQKVEVRWVPSDPGPRAVAFTYTDVQVQQGHNAYYVRVTQEDGEQAWSSPMYITFRA